MTTNMMLLLSESRLSPIIGDNNDFGVLRKSLSFDTKDLDKINVINRDSI